MVSLVEKIMHEEGFEAYLAMGRGMIIGEKGRPLSIPHVEWRILGKAQINEVKEPLRAILMSTNFAFSMPGGAEMYHHLTRDQMMKHPEECTAVIDISGAFQNSTRASTYRSLDDLKQFRHTAKVSMGGTKCESEVQYWREDGSICWITVYEGVRQGDPIAMALFCLTIHPTWVPRFKQGSQPATSCQRFC